MARATKKGENIYIAGAYPKDKRKRMVSLGLVSARTKKEALAKVKRKYKEKYRQYWVA